MVNMSRRLLCLIVIISTAANDGRGEEMTIFQYEYKREDGIMAALFDTSDARNGEVWQARMAWNETHFAGHIVDEFDRKWSPEKQLGDPAHSAAAYFNGSIYIAGGSYGMDEVSRVTSQFDTATGASTEMPWLNRGRNWPNNGRAHVIDGRLTVCGSSEYDEHERNHPTDIHTHNTCEMLSAEPGARWEIVRGPSVFWRAATTVDARGRLVVAGGYEFAKQRPRTMTNESWAMDPATYNWTRLPDMPQSRWDHSCAFYDGAVVVCGGNSIDTPRGRTAGCVRLPDGADRWQPMANMPGHRRGFALVNVGDELWALGGFGDGGNTVYVFDGVQWSPGPIMPYQFWYPAVAVKA